MKYTKHAKERLIQRYGKEYSKRLFKYVPREKIKFLKRLSCTRSLATIQVDNESIFLIINRKKNIVITVLEERMLAK
jgi:hypothetical protein